MVGEDSGGKRDLSVFVGPIRMNTDDHDALKARAVANERSVAAEIRLAVRKYLKEAA